MSFTLRPFTPDDYQAVADLQTAVFPDMPAVAADYVDLDANRDPKLRHARWMAEVDGRVVGTGRYDQQIWAYHPQKFFVQVFVLPTHQRQGIGTALYDQVMRALEPFDPVELNASTCEALTDTVRFLEKRGFVERLRAQRSELDPSVFDSTPFAGVGERLRAEHIVIKTFAELDDDPQRNRKLYDMENEVAPDIPGNDDFTPPPFERWQQDIVQRDTFLPDGMFVALREDTGEYVGSSTLWIDRASDMLYTGLTAVRRSHRRKGVATGLKVRAIQYAQAKSAPCVRTDNEETNPMLQLNYALGFRPIPAWVAFRKTIRELDE